MPSGPIDPLGGVVTGARNGADGDEVLVRISDGRVVACTSERHRGQRFIGPDSEEVEAEAIAHPPAANRSGRTRTKAERRAAGLRRLDVLLDEQTMGRLEEICEESGYSKAEQVRAMIDGDYEEWRKIVPRKRRAGKP